MVNGFFAQGVVDRRQQRQAGERQDRALGIQEKRFAFEQAQADQEAQTAKRQEITSVLGELGNVAKGIKESFNGTSDDPSLQRALSPILEQAQETVSLAQANGIDVSPTLVQLEGLVSSTPTLLEAADATAAAETRVLEGTRDARVADTRAAANAQAAAQVSAHVQKLEANFADTQRRIASGLEQAPGGLEAKDRIDIENKLRDDFTAATREHVKVADAYGRVQATDASGAGDLALIFNFMKMLDPGSVVREGEFATAQNATGVSGRVRNLYNNVIRGERLNPEMRGEFIGQSEMLWETSKDTYLGIADRYESLADDAGVSKSAVVVPLVREEFLQPAPQSEAANGGPMTVTDDGRIVDSAGNEVGRVQ